MFEYDNTQPQYVTVSADFKPLPKYGHLSEKSVEWQAAEDAYATAMAPLQGAPTLAAFRELAGDPDAVMPVGGPDRYRDVTTQLLEFPARDGHMIELKVYKSPCVESNATLMYRMHGGGWSVGRHEVDGAENVYAAAKNTRIVVVSVDYRSAPEHPFPTPLNDSYDGLIWCKEHANVLGANPEKIILSGSSAGANLAASLAIEARNMGVSGIRAQVLHFPAVCHPKFWPTDKYEFGSYVQNKDSPVLGVLMMEAFLDAYIPDAQPDCRHSPLLAKTHKGLPPALIQCAGFDILRDDAFAYAEALRQADVQVELYSYKGLPHCFPGILRDISLTADFYQRYIDFLAMHS